MFIFHRQWCAVKISTTQWCIVTQFILSNKFCWFCWMYLSWSFDADVGNFPIQMVHMDAIKMALYEFAWCEWILEIRRSSTDKFMQLMCMCACVWLRCLFRNFRFWCNVHLFLGTFVFVVCCPNSLVLKQRTKHFSNTQCCLGWRIHISHRCLVDPCYVTFCDLIAVHFICWEREKA